LKHAPAPHYVYYNFVRIHKMLRPTPALEAVVTDRLWTVRNIADLLANAEEKKCAA